MVLYDRILQIAYGLTTENVFDDALFAGAGASVVYNPATADTSATGLKAMLFAASSKVKAATGQPASVVLAAPDVFQIWGANPGLMPAAYGTQNVTGTAQASTLRINVSGLEVVEATSLASGQIIVTNELAAAWLEEGPFLVTADDVQKLGTDVAIWGMGVPALFVATGIVKTTLT
jgi:hypothetical protein